MDYDLKQWKRYASQLGFPKAEQAEKDYLQELLLMNIYSNYNSGNLILRGGTAIAKLYGSGRFSEDLDFISTAGIEISIDKLEKLIEKGIEAIKYYYDLVYSQKSYRNMIKYIVKVQGPLFTASLSRQATQTIEVDLNTYEHPLSEPVERQRLPIYENLRPFTIVTMKSTELAADKIKTIIDRTRPVARDLYDLWILIKKYKIRPDLEIVKRKLLLYSRNEQKKYTAREFKTKIKDIKKIWEIELSRLIKTVPNYNIVVKEVNSMIIDV